MLFVCIIVVYKKEKKMVKQYNKRTQLIVDQFKYGLENADKLFEILAWAERLKQMENIKK